MQANKLTSFTFQWNAVYVPSAIVVSVAACLGATCAGGKNHHRRRR